MKRIKPPKFKVRINGKYRVLNEYELRSLQVDVAMGLYSNISVRDNNNKKATILSDGSLSDDLFGLDVLRNSLYQLLKIKNQNENLSNN